MFKLFGKKDDEVTGLMNALANIPVTDETFAERNEIVAQLDKIGVAQNAGRWMQGGAGGKDLGPVTPKGSIRAKSVNR